MPLDPPDRLFFSIIIPTRNRPEQLAECLDSLTKLDFPRDRFEVIVVDDASDTPLDPLCQTFTERITLRLLRQAAGGPGAARNYGASIANGQYLAFTDDDCLPDAGWLRNLHAILKARPDELIGGRTINALTSNIYSATAQVIQDAVYAHYNAPDGHGHFFASSNFSVARARFNTIGGFPKAWSLVAAEDRVFCHFWRRQGWKMTFAPDAVIRHRHELGFISFWQLFLRYGRGAYRYHSVRDRSEAIGGIVPEAGFYRECIRYAADNRTPWQTVKVLFLLATWQLANAVGYFLEQRQVKDQRAA